MTKSLSIDSKLNYEDNFSIFKSDTKNNENKSDENLKLSIEKENDSKIFITSFQPNTNQNSYAEIQFMRNNTDNICIPLQPTILLSENTLKKSENQEQLYFKQIKLLK